MPRSKQPREDDRIRALDFNDDDRAPPRAGDRLSREEIARKLPASRTRRAGVNSAAGGNEPTGDDLTPETLLDPEGPDSPVAGERRAADRSLRRVTQSELLENGQPPRSRSRKTP